MTKRRSVSIVTPVYNGADYLEECLDSVLAQTLKDWDLAIVDNASTDKTPIIAERYARRDPRIRHVRFEDHVDLPANVNRAYLQVNPDSTWCKPLMADDWLYPNCIEQMVTAGEELDSIGLVTSYQRQGDYVLLTQVPYDQKVVPGRSVIAQNLVTGANVTGGPTAQMYKTSLVLRGGVFLEMGLEHDDTDAAFRILLDYDLGFVHQVLTYVRRQGERRTDRALQMGSDLTEQLLFIVRYGPLVLDERRYRAVLHRQLRISTTWHLKQLVRPSRLRNKEFFHYHRGILSKLRDASVARDRGLDIYIRFVGSLLARETIMSSSERARRLSRTLMSPGKDSITLASKTPVGRNITRQPGCKDLP